MSSPAPAAIVAVSLLVSGCGGGSKRRPPPRPGARPVATALAAQREDPRILRQCLADLSRQGASFQVLPDRTFAGGCSALGTVKLVRISIPTTNLGAMKCRLAERFTAWTNEAVQAAANAWLDSRVAKIESMGTYNCRPINNQAGNRLSQHGLSNAVDISGFVLESGRRITVKGDWNGADENARNFLRAVHKAGCRRFNIVLGPNANALHHDHLHFDMGPSRYCR